MRFATGSAPRSTPFSDGQADRAARQVLRERPEVIAEAVQQAPPEVERKLIDLVVARIGRGIARILPRRAERRWLPGTAEAGGTLAIVDVAAHRALEDLARRAVSRDLDQLAGEITRLHKEVIALRQLAGLPAGSLARADRRARAAELRSAGHSVRSIAVTLGASRNAIAHDLAELAVPAPDTVVGLDGRATRPRFREPA